MKMRTPKGIVIVYCYLLLFVLLVWIFTTGIWLIALNAHHQTYVFRRWFLSLLFFKSIVFPGAGGDCVLVCVPGLHSISHFRFSFCVLLCICIDIGCLYCEFLSWKRAFVDNVHKALAPCLSLSVCISKTNVPDTCFSLSII